MTTPTNPTPEAANELPGDEEIYTQAKKQFGINPSTSYRYGAQWLRDQYAAPIISRLREDLKEVTIHKDHWVKRCHQTRVHRDQLSAELSAAVSQIQQLESSLPLSTNRTRQSAKDALGTVFRTKTNSPNEYPEIPTVDYANAVRVVEDLQTELSAARAEVERLKSSAVPPKTSFPPPDDAPKRRTLGKEDIGKAKPDGYQYRRPEYEEWHLGSHPNEVLTERDFTEREYRAPVQPSDKPDESTSVGIPDNYTELIRASEELRRSIKDFLDGYELRGDEGDHEPTEFEKLLIEDAVNGLLEDRDFNAANDAYRDACRRAPAQPVTTAPKAGDKVHPCPTCGSGFEGILIGHATIDLDTGAIIGEPIAPPSNDPDGVGDGWRLVDLNEDFREQGDQHDGYGDWFEIHGEIGVKYSKSRHTDHTLRYRRQIAQTAVEQSAQMPILATQEPQEQASDASRVSGPPSEGSEGENRELEKIARVAWQRIADSGFRFIEITPLAINHFESIIRKACETYAATSSCRT